MGGCMSGPAKPGEHAVPSSPFEGAAQHPIPPEWSQQHPGWPQPQHTQQHYPQQEQTFQNPLIVEDEEAVSAWQNIRQTLSKASEPIMMDPFSAVVNTSVFGRERGRSYTLGGFQRLDSVLPKQGAQFLSWTHSRKLLEAAIAAEQQTIPEEGGPGRRQPVNEWDAIAAAEERLQRKLHKFQLDMYVMEGDGNCQFRAVSFGLYGTQDYHAYVRQKAIEHMQRQHADFEAFLGEDVGTYLREMAKPGVWGDELTLRAICDAFGICINVITSDAENWFLRYLPQQKGAPVKHEVFLTYIAPVHYNGIRRSPSSNFDRHGSFLRKHSQILRAVNEYEQRRVMPDNPERLTELAGRV